MPYDVVEDKNGDAWTGSMLTDRVTRLDPQTGRMTDYLLPSLRTYDEFSWTIQRRQSHFGVGNNHGASIIKLEPLD